MAHRWCFCMNRRLMPPFLVRLLTDFLAQPEAMASRPVASHSLAWAVLNTVRSAPEAWFGRPSWVGAVGEPAEPVQAGLSLARSNDTLVHCEPKIMRHCHESATRTPRGVETFVCQQRCQSSGARKRTAA